MSSSVQQVNRALTLLGAETISALTPEDSPAAAMAVDLYDPTVDELLAEFPWRFAVAREQLSKLTTTPANTNYTTEYALPADTLRIVRTSNDNDDWMLYRDFETGYRRLYSNSTTLWADLVRRPDPALFPAHFVEALVYRLASVLAMPITRRVDFMQAFAGMAAAALSKAKAIDWNEQPWPDMDDGNIIANARLG